MSIVIIVAVMLGLLFLVSEDELLNCRIGESACGGKANILLSHRMSDYFAPDAGAVPLLHLWYLSVILQVYLLYALGSLALHKLPNGAKIGTLMLVGVASLLLHYSFPLQEWLHTCGLISSHPFSEASYYATLPRLWEVLGGGMVYFLPELKNRLYATLLSALGLASIATAALAGGELPLTLIVVAGAVLVIKYLPSSAIPHVLCNKLLLGLGAISFSVYLVHMPIIVYGRMWEYGVPGISARVFMIAASILIGWCFWWSIEKRRFPWWLILLLWGSASILCRTGRKTEGFRNMMPLAEQRFELPSYQDWQFSTDPEYTDNWDPRLTPSWTIFSRMGVPVPAEKQAPVFLIGARDHKPCFVLLGDSHAQSLYPGFDYALRRENFSGIYLSTWVYPFHHWQVDHIAADHRYSPEKERVLLDWLATHEDITHVIISQRWIAKLEYEQSPDGQNRKFEKDLRDFIHLLRSIGKHVILIGATPEFPHIQHTGILKIATLRGENIPDSIISCNREQYLKRHAPILPILRRLESDRLCTLLDPLALLGSDDACFHAAEGSTLLMADSNHFSTEGAKRFMMKILPQLRTSLNK